MMRKNYITILLIIIVILLIVGVGISIYYVLNISNNDGKKDNSQIQIYKEKVSNETNSTTTFDLAKRKYLVEVKGKQFHMLLNTDGRMNIILQEDSVLKNKISSFIGIEKKLVAAEIENVVRAYEVNIITTKKENNLEGNPDAIEYETDVTILAITVDGSVHKLDKKVLYEESLYKFIKIEGLTDIVDIAEVKKEGSLNENDIIAINKNQEEILITEYLK